MDRREERKRKRRKSQRGEKKMKVQIKKECMDRQITKVF